MPTKTKVILTSLILFIIASSAFIINKNKTKVLKPEDSSIYKIKYTDSIAQEEIIHMDYIVFDNYLFEQIITDNTFEYKSISNSTGEIVLDSVEHRKTLNGYYLSSLDGKNTWLFDTAGKFINKIPLKEKTSGFNFKEDPLGLKQYINQFKEVGDTLVEGQKRKLVVLNLDFESEQAVYKATLDESLYGRLAIHPLCPVIDQKFQSICLSLDTKITKNQKDYYLKSRIQLIDSLSQSDKNWIAYFRNDFLKKL